MRRKDNAKVLELRMNIFSCMHCWFYEWIPTVSWILLLNDIKFFVREIEQSQNWKEARRRSNFWLPFVQLNRQWENPRKWRRVGTKKGKKWLLSSLSSNLINLIEHWRKKWLSIHIIFFWFEEGLCHSFFIFDISDLFSSPLYLFYSQ